MTKYLISFPARAMEVPAEDFAAVGEAAHEVMREAKAAGVYVFGGGINEDVAPLMVAKDQTFECDAADWFFCRLEGPTNETQ